MLVDKFFGAYQSRDLEGLMKLWSEKSPDFAASRKSFEKDFASYSQIRLKSLAVKLVAPVGKSVTVRVTVELVAVDAKIAEQARDLEMNRTLQLVNEDGALKIWRYVTCEEEIAASLAERLSEQERRALLANEKEFVNVKLVQAIINQGQAQYDKADGARALVLYSLALEIANELGDRADSARALRGVGSIHIDRGDLTGALGFFERSLKIGEELGDKRLVFGAMTDIGRIHTNLGDYDKALACHRRARALAEELGDRRGIAVALINSAVVSSNQGGNIAALEDLNGSLSIARDLHDTGMVLTALNLIGSAQQEVGNYPDALEHFEEALGLAKETGNKRFIAILMNNLGNLYTSLGNYRRAMEIEQSGLLAAEAIDFQRLIPSLMLNIGNLHYYQGNLSQSLGHYQDALARAEKTGNRKQAALLLTNIASVYNAEGDYVRALESGKSGLKLTEETGAKSLTTSALCEIGLTYQSMGDYPAAMNSFQRSLQIAEEIGEQTRVIVAVHNLADLCESQGDHSRALDLARRAAEMSKQAGSPETLWSALTIAGKSYRALDQREKARQSFETAIATIEQLRDSVAGGEEDRQRFLETRVAPYHLMADLLIGDGEAAKALAYVERAKGRVLLDVLRSGKIDVSKAMTAEEQRQERELRSRTVSLNSEISQQELEKIPDARKLADLNERLVRARSEYEEFQIKLYATHPALKAQRGDLPPVTLNESMALMADDTAALLEFVVTKDKTFLFVLSRRRSANRDAPDLHVYTIDIKQEDLASKIRNFTRRLAGRQSGFQPLASQLYDLLLKPARLQLKGRTSLVVVPDGVLWELPFQVLQPSADRYLIQDYAISYAPSLTVLREMDRHRANSGGVNPPPAKTLLAVGNPAIGRETAGRINAFLMDEKLGPLPEAEKQVAMLRKLYGARATRVYIGGEAREERVKQEAGSYRILHLATHGILNDASPMYSHLVLTQTGTGGTEDGLLEAWEIMKLDLNAELAVLSACDTARGRFGAGEGVIGLSWAFFVAGCPATVVSQWKVASTSTTELMIEFHRRLVASSKKAAAPISKAQALRQASLKLLRSRRYEHPFYWAPFVLVGADR
ncbi:MAG TPA: CHAT domain-containing protein [Blastocatellia bacterium]|nr:CHAT domain-containing protein [Blastocatellia bacterium]